MASRHQPKVYKGRDRDARGYQRKQPEVTYDQEELSNGVEVHPVTTTPTVSLHMKYVQSLVKLTSVS